MHVARLRCRSRCRKRRRPLLGHNASLKLQRTQQAHAQPDCSQLHEAAKHARARQQPASSTAGLLAAGSAPNPLQSRPAAADAAAQPSEQQQPRLKQEPAAQLHAAGSAPGQLQGRPVPQQDDKEDAVVDLTGVDVAEQQRLLASAKAAAELRSCAKPRWQPQQQAAKLHQFFTKTSLYRRGLT